MHNIVVLITGLLMFIVTNGFTQVLVTDSTENTSHPSAILEIQSTSQGLLPPRMTMEERDSIENPAPGLIIYCTDCMELQIFNDTAWTNMIGLPPSAGWQCGDSVSYLGRSYATVLIGNQCWTAENMNVGSRIDGTSSQTDNSIIEKYCYDDNEANCNTFGGLYQWDEMMQYSVLEMDQGICPTGWHIPSDEEIKTLEMALGMSQEQADMSGFVSRGTDEGSQLAGNEPLWLDSNLDMDPAFGTSGFDALPAGQRLSNGSFSALSTYAIFWSSSTSVADGWRRYLDYFYTGIFRTSISKSMGFSVRCVKD